MKTMNRIIGPVVWCKLTLLIWTNILQKWWMFVWVRHSKFLASLWVNRVWCERNLNIGAMDDRLISQLLWVKALFAENWLIVCGKQYFFWGFVDTTTSRIWPDMIWKRTLGASIDANAVIAARYIVHSARWHSNWITARFVLSPLSFWGTHM